MTSNNHLEDFNRITPKEFDFVSLNTLLSEEEEEVAWLVDEHIMKGGLSLFVGKPKTGKSTFARYLAYCVGKEEHFLGFPTRKGRVLYLALEEKRSEVKKHFKLMGATGEEEIYTHCASAPQADLIKSLYAHIKTYDADLLIIDPIFRLLRLHDLNDYAKVTNALEPLIGLARTTNCHILCVHHANKVGGSNGDSVLGSTAIFGAVDALFSLGEKEQNRYLSSQKRYGANLNDQIIILDKSTMKLSLLGDKVENDIQKAVDKILEAVSDGHSMTEINLEKFVGVRGSNFAKALKRAVELKKVIRTGNGAKGSPFLYSSSDSSSQLDILSRTENNMEAT